MGFLNNVDSRMFSSELIIASQSARFKAYRLDASSKDEQKKVSVRLLKCLDAELG